MDIDLFSDIVKNLIVDNDEVALPGLGTCVSELMPSTFSDKGYTINPPYRRLSFRQRWKEEDTLLVDFYSRANGTDREASERILSKFIEGLKDTLQSKKSVQLPGLGRLRATTENTFFFIADEDLDIYPYGFGLEPVSLKTHEETQEEVPAVQEVPAEEPIIQPLQETPAAKEAPEEMPQAEEAPAVQAEVPSAEEAPEEPVAEEEPVADEEAPEVPEKGPLNYLAIAIFAVGVILLALLAFTIIARMFPGIFDFILYSPEELRLLNS